MKENKNKYINIRVTENFEKFVFEYANKKGKNVSDMIREFIENGINDEILQFKKDRILQEIELL